MKGWGYVLVALGLVLGVARAAGGFGNPTLADGAVLLILLLIGSGGVMLVKGESR